MAFIMTRTHGTAIVAEQPASGILLQVDGTAYTDVTGKPFGWGKTFRIATGQGTWFHIAVPTVAQLDESRLFLDQFFLFFETETGSNGGFTTQIAAVHAYDGSARIFQFRPPEPYAGDWSNPREVTDESGFTFGNTWFPRDADGGRIGLNTGLGLSVNAGALEEGNITFHSAGASFVDSPR